jgi:hypothetical protein
MALSSPASWEEGGGSTARCRQGPAKRVTEKELENLAAFSVYKVRL